MTPRDDTPSERITPLPTCGICGAELCDAQDEWDHAEPDCEHGLSAWLCAGPQHYPTEGSR